VTQWWQQAGGGRRAAGRHKAGRQAGMHLENPRCRRQAGSRCKVVESSRREWQAGGRWHNGSKRRAGSGAGGVLAGTAAAAGCRQRATAAENQRQAGPPRRAAGRKVAGRWSAGGRRGRQQVVWQQADPSRGCGGGR